MRKIIFRGKIDDYDHKWVYGSLLSGGCLEDKVVRILDNETGDEENVIPETVGQFTGLTDKNGKKIFEGDIANCVEFNCCGKIDWNSEEAGFYFSVLLDGGSYEEEFIYDYSDELEIIGNIYDNPEMLKSKVD